MGSEPLTPFASALAGALGAVFSNAAVYPLDTVKTRLQALPNRPSSPTTSAQPSRGRMPVHAQIIGKVRRDRILSMLIKIVKTEGLAGVFKGFSASMIGTFSQQFAYFFFHTFLRTSLLARLAITTLSTSQELLLGALAGALAQIFTIPVSVIATRQQLSTKSHSSSSSLLDNDQSDSLLGVGRQIIKEGGITALWTGLKPGLVLTVNPAITYGCFERMKSWLLSGDRLGGKLTAGEAFLLGVGSKTLATVVTYPYIFAKVRLQSRSSTSTSSSASSSSVTHTSPPPNPTTTTTSNSKTEFSSAFTASSGPGAGTGMTFAEIASHPPSSNSAVIESAHEKPSSPQSPPSHPAHPASSNKATRRDGDTGGALDILKRVYADEGVGGWYTGLTAQITKAVLSQGILFVSKEKFESYAILILALIGRMRQGQARELREKLGGVVAVAKV